MKHCPTSRAEAGFGRGAIKGTLRFRRSVRRLVEPGDEPVRRTLDRRRSGVLLIWLCSCSNEEFFMIRAAGQEILRSESPEHFWGAVDLGVGQC